MIIFIKGIIIGICAILPGISGSVIAISLGIYEETIEAISSFKNFKYIVIIITGIIIGVYVTSFFLINLLEKNDYIYSILIGIIISEIPLINKRIRIKTNNHIAPLPFLIAFTISTMLCIFNNSVVSYSSPIKYFIGGLFFSFGKIFPGVSSSFFLLTLGIYENIILLILNPFFILTKFQIYLPFIFGSFIGVIIFSKLLKYLMNNYYRLTYSIISGLILSSISLLIPKLSIIGSIITSITILISILYKTKKDFL